MSHPLALEVHARLAAEYGAPVPFFEEERRTDVPPPTASR